MILEYVMKFHLQDCIAILSEKDTLGYFSIKIDFLKLFESYPDVGDKVLCEAVESLPLCNKDIIKAQQNILEFDTYKEEYCSLKRNVQARFFGLPVCPELHRAVFPKNVDLGCFLKVTGTVVRVTQSKMLEYQRKYVCMKCKYENCIEAEFENRYILRAPTKCRNEESRCKCSTFTQVNMVSREFCKDYQEIKIQEQVNKLSIGTIPGSMWVVLENDLVDCCKPGDDVVICSTVRRRWRPSVQTKKSEVELVLQANYLEVCNARQSEVIATAPDVKDYFNEFWSKYELCPLKGRDQILKTVCPQVYGLYSVKLAVLLTVITGSNHITENETDKKSLQDEGHAMRVRGQCHLLLVGDPGTGKSQLLRAGVDLTARSVFTSGAGSTRAGLTCAALREDGEWQLEAGALVLSDGGVCCIDEISQLREHDRTAIHEAMEQQTLSIAKAGIVCKLNTRCAIIAACNPKGHYATDQTLSTNVSLGTPLLSRFDLIFILLDSKHKAWDKLVSSYILFGGLNAPDLKNKWSLEKLQMYISLVGPRQTEMTRSANIILQSYYMAQRKSEHRDPSRTTVRMLDSLVRLAQAHCRLMYRTNILPMDAIVAVSLVDLSMQDCTLSDTVDALHSTFQKYPDFEYLCTAKKLLTKLYLHDIWQKELLYYGRLMQVDCRTLESDIDNGSYRLFAKCDDILDDNVHLSSSLVTSSYFNANKKDSEDLSLKGDKENKTVENPVTRKVNEKLAKTLKKHANLNKEDKNLPAVLAKKVTNKRKRKQVTANTFALNAKIAKQSKTSARSEAKTASSDNEGSDAIDIMNAVPSVNDIFTDLGIHFEIGTNHHNHVTNNLAERKSQLEADTTIINSCSTQNNSIKEMEKQGKSCSSKTISKLKEFECIKTHDYTKFTDISIKEEKSNDNLTGVLVKSKQNSSSSSTNQNSSAPSSQISIFECSDYEINLDF